MLRIFTLALCLSMTGCLFTVDSSQKSNSAQWTNGEIERIEIGQTDAQWIRTTFGAPRRQSTYTDGTQIWRYDNTRESESRVGLFLLFNVKVDREHAETLAIELTNNVVSDYWVESR